ncbi:MAG: HAMP domain-containing sensor histidine kinase [Myxococcota bacterium]
MIEPDAFQRARTGLYIKFVLGIALIGVFTFAFEFLFVRPLMVGQVRESFIQELAIPMIDSALRECGWIGLEDSERPAAVAIESLSEEGARTPWFLPESEPYRIQVTSGAHQVNIGPVRGPAPPLTIFLLFVTLTSILTAVGSATLLALPLARRLRRLHRAFEAVGERGAITQIPVDSDDVVGQLGHGFNDMAERVARAMQDREELLQAVSHELGTPLARLRVLLALQHDAAPNDSRHLVAMTQELDELTALTHELVDYVQTDNDVPDYEACDLSDAVSAAVEEHRAWSQHEIDFEGVSDEVLVRVAARDVHRCVDNLLRNAERYASSKIMIRVTFDRDHVQLEVRDDGPGVPDEHRERIFEPFGRGEASRTRSAGGVGLGLAIVRRLLERAGGSVQVGDHPDGGAVFFVRWPRAHYTQNVDTPALLA